MIRRSASRIFIQNSQTYERFSPTNILTNRKTVESKILVPFKECHAHAKVFTLVEFSQVSEIFLFFEKKESLILCTRGPVQIGKHSENCATTSQLLILHPSAILHVHLLFTNPNPVFKLQLLPLQNWQTETQVNGVATHVCTCCHRHTLHRHDLTTCWYCCLDYTTETKENIRQVFSSVQWITLLLDVNRSEMQYIMMVILCSVLALVCFSRSIIHLSTSLLFLLFYSPKPRSQVRILIYRKWSIG